MRWYLAESSRGLNLQNALRCERIHTASFSAATPTGTCPVFSPSYFAIPSLVY